MLNPSQSPKIQVPLSQPIIHLVVWYLDVCLVLAVARGDGFYIPWKLLMNFMEFSLILSLTILKNSWANAGVNCLHNQQNRVLFFLTVHK